MDYIVKEEDILFKQKLNAIRLNGRLNLNRGKTKIRDKRGIELNGAPRKMSLGQEINAWYRDRAKAQKAEQPSSQESSPS